MIISKNEKKIEKVKKHLDEEFTIKDLGEIKYCLGIEFARNEGTLTMHQSSYIMEILDRFGMTDCRPVGTPMDSNVKLVKPDETDQGEKKVPYRELIGALMYLAVSTRPDIAYTVSSLSQFNDCNGLTHWTAAKRVLRYHQPRTRFQTLIRTASVLRRLRLGWMSNQPTIIYRTRHNPQQRTNFMGS